MLLSVSNKCKIIESLNNSVIEDNEVGNATIIIE